MRQPIGGERTRLRQLSLRAKTCATALLLFLAISTVGSFDRSVAADDPAPPTLLEEARAFRTALDRAAASSHQQGELGIRLSVYESARTYEIIDRLVVELAKEKPLPLILEGIRADQKRLDRLGDRPGVRLELSHPRHDPKKKPGQPIHVHLFPANLDKSAPIEIGKKAQRWTAWRETDGLEKTRVRIARHYKFVKRRQVPIVTALSPKTERYVLRGERGSLWTLLPSQALEEKSRRIGLRLLAVDHYHGPYDRRHIVDLNADGHAWTRGLSFRIEGRLPTAWPRPTPRLQEIVDQLTGTPDSD